MFYSFSPSTEQDSGHAFSKHNILPMQRRLSTKGFAIISMLWLNLIKHRRIISSSSLKTILFPVLFWVFMNDVRSDGHNSAKLQSVKSAKKISQRNKIGISEKRRDLSPNSIFLLLVIFSSFYTVSSDTLFKLGQGLRKVYYQMLWCVYLNTSHISYCAIQIDYRNNVLQL